MLSKTESYSVSLLHTAADWGTYLICSQTKLPLILHSRPFPESFPYFPDLGQFAPSCAILSLAKPSFLIISIFYLFHTQVLSWGALCCCFLNPEWYLILSWSLLLLWKAELCLKIQKKICMASSVFPFSYSLPFKANTSVCLPITIHHL